MFLDKSSLCGKLFCIYMRAGVRVPFSPEVILGVYIAAFRALFDVPVAL